MIGIYMIKNKINGKMYIGESFDIERRWQEHTESLMDNRHHSWKLQTDWNEYGKDNFSFEILKELKSYKSIIMAKAFLIILEHAYIDKLRTLVDGYNIENTYLKIKNNDKALFDGLGDRWSNIAFRKVDLVYNLCNICKRYMNEEGYMDYASFCKIYKCELNTKKYNLSYVLTRACKKIGITSKELEYKDNLKKARTCGAFDNEYLDNRITIINKVVYINIEYIKDVRRQWIKSNFSFDEYDKFVDGDVQKSFTNKNLSNHKAKNGSQIYSLFLKDLISNIENFNITPITKLTDLIDSVGLSRSVISDIKKDLKIDTKIKNIYPNGFYTEEYTVGDFEPYITIFITEESKKYILEYIMKNKKDKIIKKNVRDNFIN